MKALKRLWQLISGRSQPALSDALAMKALDKLESAQRAHIGDLRVLIDQSNAREAQLAGMVKLVMEERFYRPVVTRSAAPNRSAGLPAEAYSDVAVFDEKADQATIQADHEREQEVAQEFIQILNEENDWRKQQGMPPIVGES